MDKTFVAAIIAIIVTLGGIVAAGVHGLHTETGTVMHSYSDIDEHGARTVVTWRE